MSNGIAGEKGKRVGGGESEGIAGWRRGCWEEVPGRAERHKDRQRVR